ncbi:MAG: hypothetical protein ACKVUS_07180 [Saprospiraceae bacterium]
MKQSTLSSFKPLFALLLCSTFALPLSAQRNFYLSKEEAEKQSKEAVKNAEFVFEGYCLEDGRTYSDSTGEYWVFSLVVTYCYKGNLSLGTVRVVRPQTWEKHRAGYGLRKYIFVCNKTDFPLPVGLSPPTNLQPIQFFSEYVPSFFFNHKPDSITYDVAGLYGLLFRTKAEFHDFLFRSSEGIVLPPVEGTSKKNAPSPIPQVPEPDTIKYRGKNPYEGAKSNENLKFSVRNQRVYQDAGKNYYAFDLYGQVFTSGLHLVHSAVIFKFNRSAFGLNPNPTYRWKAVSDLSFPDNVATASGGNVPNDTTINVTVVPMSFLLPNDTIKLATVYLEVGLDTVCCKLSGLTFKTETAYADYYIDNPNNFLAFTTETAPIDAYKLCSQPMTITSVSPLLTHAGNGETIEIKGKGFGAIRGDVLFKNADTGGEASGFDEDGFLNGLDSIWIEIWRDTLIKVIVPSHTAKGNLGGIPFSAGSGPIIVKQSPCGDTLRSAQKVNVEYSFRNIASGNRIDKLYLLRRHCINWLVFTFDSTIQQHPNGPQMVAVMNAAFMQWAGFLGITITYEKNAAGNAPVFTNNRNDPERNVIYLTPSGGGMSYTPIRTGIDSTNGIKFYTEKGAIKIDPSANWNYSLSGDLSVQQQDFFWAFLHEVGHAIGLDHDIDLTNGFKNMMHYTTLPSLFGSDRPNMDQWSTRARKGAQDIVAQSKTKTWKPPTLATLSNINSIIVSAPTINPAGTRFICCGQENIVLAANHPTETTGWLWTPGGQTTQNITTTRCGDYRVRIAPPGCAKTSLPSAPTLIRLGSCPTGGGHDEERLSIQPNPGDIEVHVYYEAFVLESNLYIQVTSATGNLVEEIAVSESSGNVILYTQSWPSGTYWVTFRSGITVIDTDPLVIQH